MKQKPPGYLSSIDLMKGTSETQVIMVFVTIETRKVSNQFLDIRLPRPRGARLNCNVG